MIEERPRRSDFLQRGDGVNFVFIFSGLAEDFSLPLHLVVWQVATTQKSPAARSALSMSFQKGELVSPSVSQKVEKMSKRKPIAAKQPELAVRPHNDQSLVESEHFAFEYARLINAVHEMVLAECRKHFTKEGAAMSPRAE
ncbi:hypothetical protein IVA95_29090 [Bradyrhizobium sp. 157]|uniref:hypothetical protein n=1 Tax=Bradyrhizobium sp. 157 TaxID=2782631 RepID=UPI001FF9A453|nr:hypothetical protein [Bradyrhizobium sp. 157]MCK1641493.1 hypothetical protein [Bradyrhizobium sp. 157]